MRFAWRKPDRVGFWLLFLLIAYAYQALQTAVYERRSERRENEVSVSLPVVVQLAMSFGDRFLAANVGAFRAAMTGIGRLPDESYQALGEIQSSAAFLNPGHEDNYYFAQAVLPWNGQIDATQAILARAIAVRVADDLPPFFFGFNRMHFLGDAEGGAKSLELAAERSAKNRDLLTNIAAAWYAKGNDPAMAIGFVKALAERSRNPGLRQHLLDRARRLEAIRDLNVAVAEFKRRFHRLPQGLDELVIRGVLTALPVDPWGKGFELSGDGKVVGKGKET